MNVIRFALFLFILCIASESRGADSLYYPITGSTHLSIIGMRALRISSTVDYIHLVVRRDTGFADIDIADDWWSSSLTKVNSTADTILISAPTPTDVNRNHHRLLLVVDTISRRISKMIYDYGLDAENSERSYVEHRHLEFTALTLIDSGKRLLARTSLVGNYMRLTAFSLKSSSGGRDSGSDISFSAPFDSTRQISLQVSLEEQGFSVPRKPINLEVPYPNPATLFLFVPSSIGSSSVVDLLGRTRLQTTTKEGTIRFDVSGLENGTYFLVNGARRSRFIVRR